MKFYRLKSFDGLRIISKYHNLLNRSPEHNQIVYYYGVDGYLNPDNVCLIKYYRDSSYFLNKKYKKFAKELNIKL